MNYFNYTSIIPKGQKGWKAETMLNWSKEEMARVLQEYGKEGLTQATYTYLNKRVNPSLYLSTSNTITNELVKELQRALGFTGKQVDGLYGANTMKAMREKFGTSDFHQAFKQIKQLPPKQTYPMLYTVKGLDGNTSIPGILYFGNTTAPQTDPTDKEETKSGNKEKQKGVDYRGGQSWTQSRVDANLEHSTNAGYAPPMVAPMKDLPAAERQPIDPMLVNQVKLTPETLFGTPDYAKIRADRDKELDKQHGKGNWYYGNNGQVITRKQAPAVGYSVFTIPNEWSEFIEGNQTKKESVLEKISDNAVASYLLGDDSGFHTGSWLVGEVGKVPMYLSDEESLDDAYAKAYAAGNRRFTYKGKTYTTTSYTDAGKDYMQAVYDALFEMQRDGKVSEATQARLAKTKAAWANDEMKRFGIDARTLGSEHTSGYPIAKNYNIANNVGQFGYDNGAGRMIMASNGWLDLGQNNTGKHNLNGEDYSTSDRPFMNKVKAIFGMFSPSDVDLTDKLQTPLRTALLKLGVSLALEDGSPEQKKVQVLSEILPGYTQTQPTNYAYTVDKVTSFTPNEEDGLWLQKSSGNYTRVGIQNNGTMWNATEVYDPKRQVKYIYDVNDYGMGPNGAFGWKGYAAVPVVSKSSNQTAPAHVATPSPKPSFKDRVLAKANLAKDYISSTVNKFVNYNTYST